VGVLAYVNTFTVPFLLDDNAGIVENDSIRHLWPPGRMLSPPGQTTVAGRPVANVTFAVNYALGGLNVLGYHILNLAIHVLAALVLFGIVRLTLRTPGLENAYGAAASPLALVVALIWLVHPLQTESVTYVVQRVESLMGLFYLLTLYCAIRGFTSERVWWSVGAVAFCALGMATKEVMVSAPLMVLLYDRVFVSGSFREVFRRRWKPYVGLAATWVILAALVATGPRIRTVGFEFKDMAVLDYALAQGPIVLHYLRLAFWPQPLVFDYGWVMPQATVGVAPGVLAMTGVFAASVLALVFRPRLGFLGAWFFLILAPSSSVLPIRTELAAEHRMYLPLAAVVVLVVVGCRWVGLSLPRSWRRPAGAGLAVVVVALLGYAARQRNGDYRSPLVMWTDTVAKQPDNFRAQNNLGSELKDAGRLDEAITHYREAIRLKPDCQPAYCNMGTALTLRGEYAEAVDSFARALLLKPDDDITHYHVGYCLLRLGGTAEAVKHFRQAAALTPTDARRRQDIAAMLAGYGEVEEATGYYREAMQLKPDWPEPVNNLAWLRATHPDAHFRNGVEAVALAKRACELTGYKAPWTLDTLAAAHAEAGDFAEAVRVAEKALEIASSSGQDEMVKVLGEHLALYRSRRPCRERPEEAKPYRAGGVRR